MLFFDLHEEQPYCEPYVHRPTYILTLSSMQIKY